MLKQIFHRLALAAVLVSAACTALPAPIADVITQPTTQGPIGEVTEESSPTAQPTATATPSNAPDLSGESIPLIYLCARTGPFSALYASRILAVEEMVADINANGGVFGAQLELHMADSTAAFEGARAAYARMLRQVGEGPIILICDPFAEQAVVDLVNDDEIPALSPGVFAEDGGFLFGLDARPEQHLAYFLQDLSANWEERKPTGGDQIRLAILTWPVELSGSPATEAALPFAEELGVEIVFQQEISAELDYNMFDLIYALREANANVIFTNARGFGLAGLLNGLNHLGLRERFVVGSPAIFYDSQLYEYLADPAFAEGLYLSSAWAAWTETEHAGIQLAQELLGDSSADWGTLQMLGAVDLAHRALEEAILAEGFEALSPDTVSDALTSLADYPVMGGLFSVNYSREERSLSALRTLVVGKTQGELLPLSEYVPVPDF